MVPIIVGRFENSLSGICIRLFHVAEKDQTIYCFRGKKMRGLLVIGGEIPNRDLVAEYRRGASIVVAADSGLESSLALGIEPDLVIGDMDSLRDKTLLDRYPPHKKMIFDSDKDETDTEIGLRVLRERGCAEVAIAGGSGGRVDHLLAVAELFEREDPPSRWITANEDIRLIEGTCELRTVLASIVSLFPVGPRAAKMHSEGLKWPLDGLTFSRGFYGISNVVTGDPVRIEVGVGKLLMIRLMSEDRTC
jgi:thiamine pyrophosphokinase